MGNARAYDPFTGQAVVTSSSHAASLADAEARGIVRHTHPQHDSARNKSHLFRLGSNFEDRCIVCGKAEADPRHTVSGDDR